MPTRPAPRPRRPRAPSVPDLPWPDVAAITQDRLRRLHVRCEQVKRQHREALLAGRAPGSSHVAGAARLVDERPSNGPGRSGASSLPSPRPSRTASISSRRSWGI